MIFFFLKLVRLVFRLVAKVVLFPVRLVMRLAGSGKSSEMSVDGDDLLDVGPEQAATHLSRFRRGLLVLGAFQLLIVLVAAADISSQVPAAGQTALLGGIAVIAAIAVVTLLLGYALAYRPTVAWYGAMGLVGIQFLGSLITLPGGLLGLILFGLLGYWGYTGRPALGAVYGSDDAGSAPDSTTAATAPAEPEPTGDGATPDSTTAATEPAETAATTAGETGAGSAEGQPQPTDPTDDPDPATAADPTPEPAGESSDTAATSSAAASSDETGTTTDEAGTAAGGTETTAEAETAADGTADTHPSSAESRPAGDADPVAPHADDLTAADAETRATAVRDLAATASDDGVPPQAVVDALTERLDDDDPDVRAAACEELGRLGVADARPHLEDRRIDPDPEVSRAASRALRNID